MTWSLRIPATPADGAASALDDELKRVEGVLAEQEQAYDAGAKAQIDAALEAAKAILDSGVVEADNVVVELAGHATPGGRWVGAGSSPNVSVTVSAATAGVAPVTGPAPQTVPWGVDPATQTPAWGTEAAPPASTPVDQGGANVEPASGDQPDTPVTAAGPVDPEQPVEPNQPVAPQTVPDAEAPAEGGLTAVDAQNSVSTPDGGTPNPSDAAPQTATSEPSNPGGASATPTDTPDSALATEPSASS